MLRHGTFLSPSLPRLADRRGAWAVAAAVWESDQRPDTGRSGLVHDRIGKVVGGGSRASACVSGAAPGVGKSYAMLAEGQRRRGHGTDVVIGLVEPHGRRRVRSGSPCPAR
nr:hypothetical protein [Streptomyces misionensis]